MHGKIRQGPHSFTRAIETLKMNPDIMFLKGMDFCCIPHGLLAVHTSHKMCKEKISKKPQKLSCSVIVKLNFMIVELSSLRFPTFSNIFSRKVSDSSVLTPERTC